MMKLRNYQIAILAGVISGLLQYFAYYSATAWFSFFSLVPLLVVFPQLQSKKNILISFILFLAIWLVPHCSPLYNYSFEIVSKASPLILLLIISIKALSFIPFFSNLRYRKKLIIFCSLWLLMDYIWLNWELKIPFFTLSIPLGTYPKLIQWFQITGILGGTLWLLLINALISFSIGYFNSFKKLPLEYLLGIFLLWAIPTGCSLYLYNQPVDGKKCKVRIVSFSLDVEFDDAEDKCLNFIGNDTVNYDFTVFPEMTFQLVNKPLKKSESFGIVQKKAIENKNNYIVSANLVNWNHQEVYACLFNPFAPPQRRYKQVYVPFGEYNPDFAPRSIRALVNKHRGFDYLPNDDNNPVFVNNKDTIFAAICYEAFFEPFIRGEITSDVEAIFVIAREPFNGNKHYARYSSRLMQILAITFQKPIVRSSWGGVSCIIDNQGNIIKECYNKNQIITGTIKLNNHQTIFNTLNN